jgi:transposase
MKSVEQITELEEENLKAIKKHHLKYRERERAMGILLSYKGYSPKEIGDIFEISERVVYTWIDNFNKNGVIGLLTQKGQGRKSILTKEDEVRVKELVEKYPFQLSTVCSELLNDGIEVSKKTLKAFLKSLDIPIKEQELQLENKRQK